MDDIKEELHSCDICGGDHENLYQRTIYFNSIDKGNNKDNRNLCSKHYEEVHDCKAED